MQIALAPMEGLVDDILRDVLTRVGGIDWCVTEFIRVNDQLLTPAYFHKFGPELLNGARTASGVPLRVQLLVPTRCAWRKTLRWPASSVLKSST